MGMERFYKRKTIELECEVVTPMFLGGANQEAEWRAAPFKNLLRYWWRVTQHGVTDVGKLREAEGKLFGQAGDDNDSGKSLMGLLVVPAETAKAENGILDKLKEVRHEECEKQKQMVQPLLYLAGMGLADAFSMRAKHSFFRAGAAFHLHLDSPESLNLQLQEILVLIQAFGAIGGRCRNGWGSFQMKGNIFSHQEAERILDRLTMNWTNALARDYPNCLGKDGRGPLLWKTGKSDRWQEAMRDLAKAYIDVRAHEVKVKNDIIEKINPGANKNQTIQERHLLGIPLTNHRYGKPDSRHASPLRFVVKRQAGGFHGFILHLPHGHSKQQMQGSNVNQLQVWEKVHRKLDGLAGLVSRATYKEVLP